MPNRPTPFDLVFEPIAAERFPIVQASLRASNLDPDDPEAFILDRAVMALLRELVPEESGAIQEHLALLHHAFLFWADGRRTFSLSARALAALVSESPGPAIPKGAGVPRAYYIQFPQRVVWAALGGPGPREPLDGLFVRPWPNGGVFALAVFGLHESRAGFTVVEVEGYHSDSTGRADGTAAFTPIIPGGAKAGLLEIVGEDELVELALRSVPTVTRVLAEREGPVGPDLIEIA